MNFMEIYKMIGAILGALLFVIGVGFIAQAIYVPATGSGGGYALPVASADTAKTPPTPLAVLLANASVDNGKQIARKCQACHELTKGGASSDGPVLYGVVGRPSGTIPGYDYSDTLKAMAAKGEIWTYERINKFITAPRKFAPGTKMPFLGLPKPEDRADVLAYLQTLSDSPVPFPKVENDGTQAVTNTAETPATTPASEPTSTVAANGGDTTPAQGDASGLSALLANASVDNGQKLARKCTACHDLSKGGRNKFGPALYDVVDRAIGTHPDYKYSSAFKELAAKGEIWTYARLDEFLTKPREDVKGTKMSFRGFSKPEDRADILAYLQTLSDSPVAFP